ncbi:MAG: hypothetical protein ACRYF4_12430 [Janthinobacterium lividum]
MESFVSNPLEADVTPALRGLWHASRSEWDAAHNAVQDDAGMDSAWVHALLHREEGDAFNAAYWYRRAGKAVCKASLADERKHMILALLTVQETTR